jgi:hypothetical protein
VIKIRSTTSFLFPKRRCTASQPTRQYSFKVSQSMVNNCSVFASTTNVLIVTAGHFHFNHNNNNHGSTALYELGPPLSEVTKSCAFVAVGDWSAGRASVLSILMCPPQPSGRQSGDLSEKWRQFGLRNIFIHARKVLLHAVNLRLTALLPLRRKLCYGFLSPLKNPSTSVGIEPANLGSSGKHANH